MKELEQVINQNQDKQEVRTPQKQEYKFEGSIQVPKGTSLWYFNLNTMKFGKVEPFKVENKVDFKTGKVSEKKKASHDSANLYVLAINAKNAARKFNNMEILKSNNIKINLR